MFDWQKKNKENAEVNSDKMAEQQRQAEQMYDNLRRSGDGDNFKVEEDKSVVGQRRSFHITDKNGAQTDVAITENAQIEIRGEQKEVRNAIERGEKISNLNPTQESNSVVQQDVLARINSSNLSENEKQQMREDVEKHNFADNKQTSEQYSQEVQANINTKENAKLNDAEKIQSLRGLGNKSKSRKSGSNRIITNVMTTNLVGNIPSRPY